jgi:diaminopropionate ammonia-lyase
MRRRDQNNPRVNLPRAFHTRLPHYSPTPLLDIAELAQLAGVGRVLVKDETNRLDTRSYEILGAAWAIYRSALERLGKRPRRWYGIDDLAPQFEPLRPLRVVTISDNHLGLAVARAARWLGFDATIFIPGSSLPERRAAIEAEGARVVTAGASYDDALAEASLEVSPEDLLISDMSWEAFEDVPSWVIDGYVTIFEEIADELSARGLTLDALLLPMGTGALGAAASDYLRTEQFGADLRLIGVEPEAAACFAESSVAGRRVAAPDPAPSIMTSLARGLPSPLAFGPVMAALDGFVAITDDEADGAVLALEEAGVVASSSGAASLAGLVAARWDLDLPADACVVVLCTEGPLR